MIDFPFSFCSNIDAAPVGLTRGVKKIMKNKIPDLGSLTDISEFVTGYAAILISIVLYNTLFLSQVNQIKC